MASVKLVIAYIIFIVHMKITIADKPCAALPFEGQSVVCVCNGTYCDEVTRDIPERGQYVAYTSSEGGLRFYKTHGSLDQCTDNEDTVVIELDPNVKYQSMLGFGGAATDAAGIQWASLPEPQRKLLVNTYFGCEGLEYNMIRVPLAGTDFSTRIYSYQDSPENDTMLTNFQLADEDILYKIPLIKSCMGVATDAVHVVGSNWSPPLWMKNIHNVTGTSHLLPEYYDTYALYHSKFIKEYNKHGIPIWGLTTTNEPIDGQTDDLFLNDLGWTNETMAKYIVENFGPLMRKEHKDVKILAVDDQRTYLDYFFMQMVKTEPALLKYIDGIAVHWYYDNMTSPQILSEIAEAYPDKFILYTEACNGYDADKATKVIMGSWQRAKRQILDIMEDINHYTTGWIDWNMFLNTEGGPSWTGNYLDSPILVDANSSIFYKQPMYYGLGHFSKFIRRDSVRIGVKNQTSAVSEVAVLTPSGTIVVVLYNDLNSTSSVTVREGQREANLVMEPNSITTIEFLTEQ